MPGAYGAGTAGKIIGDNVKATISSRSSHSAADVWAVSVRTLSTFGTLVADIATAVWGAVARTITGGTVTTNSDKTGYSLTVTPPTAAQVRAEIDSNSTQLAAIVADTAEIQAELADGGRTDLLIDGIKTVTDHLGTAMELDGAVYRFTENALEEAPGGGSGGDTVIASAPATSGADGFLQLSTYTAGVVIYTRDSASQSSMNGSTLKSAAANALVSHVGENLLVVGTVKSEGAIKLYIPKLSIVVTTSLAGRFIYFNTLAGDNKFMAPGSAALSQPQNASMFAHWDRELSAVEVDTFYLEMKKQFSLLGLAI